MFIIIFFQDFLPNLKEKELKSLIEIRSEKIKNTRETTSRNISVEQEKQKAQFAKRKTKKSETIGVGMQVLKYNANKRTRKGDRLQPEYSGPYTIEDITTGKVTLRNKDTNQVLKRKSSIKDQKIYHSDKKWYVLM
jgi:FKBP-type peptidyl-prolyl cis-trans isomerase